jgi:cellulose/xylan binding protein with CBM9 domain
VAMRIPFAMMESYVSATGDPRGQTWRGNLFKCGDETSHPHWASWAPIGQELNFHQPEKFGELRFE